MTEGVLAPSRLDAVLRESGALHSGSVATVETASIGTGQMAQTLRLDLGYDGPSDGPASLVAKLPSADKLSRRTGRATRAYEVEVGFYRDLAGSLGVRTPRCLHASIDLTTHDFLILLEDLTPAAQGDQLAGCGADLAERVVHQAVAFQAPRWADPGLAGIGWLDRNSPEAAAVTAAFLASSYPGFLDRFGSELDQAVLDGLALAVDRVHDWWRAPTGSRTLVHGDLRLDNLLIGDGPDDLWVVDWQTLVLGDGVCDVSYFLGGNLAPEVRRTCEEELVHVYHDALRTAGVDDLAWDDCWQRYRAGSWYGVYLTLGASLLVVQSERGDRMFVCHMDRHVRHALDLDAASAKAAVDDRRRQRGAP